MIKLNRLALAAFSSLVLTLSMAASALAQPASLTSRDPNARINVRSEPSTRSSSPHYGLPGDGVQVLRTVQGQDGWTWYFVRFNESKATGWIRSDFVVFN
jgi:hypothetical protein